MTEFDIKAEEKFRVIFLGDRKISWESLKLLCSEKYSSIFEIRAIVSDDNTYTQYRDMIEENNICFISNSERHTSSILSAIKGEEINLLISVQYNWIIPANILNSVNRFAFNLHNAKLPDYKGYNSISHAILNEDELYESTIHWMEDKVDSGDIAFVGTTSILATDTAQSLYLRTIKSALWAFEQLLEVLCRREMPPRTPLNGNQGHFYNKESIKKISDVTHVNSKLEISKIARAAYFPPYNTAFFVSDGVKYNVIPAIVSNYQHAKPVNQPDV